MTNYNDGKWHGWNGGECPVHPESKVHVAFLGGGRDREDKAGEFGWSDKETPIIAFRVVKEYKKPREWWVNIYPDGTPGYAWNNKEAAEVMRAGYAGQVVKVREVIE